MSKLCRLEDSGHLPNLPAATPMGEWVVFQTPNVCKGARPYIGPGGLPKTPEATMGRVVSSPLPRCPGSDHGGSPNGCGSRWGFTMGTPMTSGSPMGGVALHHGTLGAAVSHVDGVLPMRGGVSPPAPT